MQKDDNTRTFRFQFNDDTPAPSFENVTIVTRQAMESLGYRNTETMKGLREALSSVCSLVDAVSDDDISYLDLVEEYVPQPDTGGYRIKRRLYWPGGHSAAEETDDTETDLVHKMLDSIEEYAANQTPAGTVTYTASDGSRKNADMAPFSPEQREIIIRCLNSERNPSLLLSLAPDGSPLYDAGQMTQILTALTRKLSKPEMDMISNPLLASGQMRQVRLGLITDRLSIKDVRRYAHPDYSEIRMEQIRLALKDGTPADVIKSLADPKLDDAQILLTRLNALKDMPEQESEPSKITSVFGKPEKADPADVSAYTENI